MKKSNIILVILLVSLYITPAIVWGFYKATSSGDYYTGFGDDIRIIQIENPGLTKDDILVNTKYSSTSAGITINKQTLGDSYLYYKGSRKYLPEVSREDDVLFTGKAADAPVGEKLKLHIRIQGLYEIRLNGEIVWRR